MNFSLPYIDDPCAITDTETDSFILTGGYQTPTATKNVSRYKQNGFVEELPSLNHGRDQHGCGSYRDKKTGTLVLIVAGGRTFIDYNTIQRKQVEERTTEKLEVGDNSWRVIKPLPRQMVRYPKFVSMNNKLFIFGSGNREDILEFDNENKEWKKVG